MTKVKDAVHANAVAPLSYGVRLLEADVLSAAPSIAMCVSMLGGMLVWPQITRRYERKKAAADEKRRRSAYSDYLTACEQAFRRERDEQAAVLQENRVSAAECLRWAQGPDPRLMGRSPLEPDFMQLRVGTGTLPLEADFKWPQKRFTMDKDDLLDLARNLSKRPPVLEGAPVALDLASSWVTGVAGERARRWGAVRGLVAQAAALYNPHDVKVAVVAGADNVQEEAWVHALPHALAEDGRTRLLAHDEATMRELSAFLAHELAGRSSEGSADKAVYKPYYLVVCVDRALVDSSDAMARLMALQDNRGFSLVFMADDVDGLPRECRRVVELAEDGTGKLYDRSDVAGSEQAFSADPGVGQKQIAQLAQGLARLGLGEDDAAFELPESLGFLETFQARTVADLGVEGLWESADASRSLAAPIGLDSRGSLAVLDPHEAFDGPHGLVAGTTGSGKSEMLITWILSTAMHFPPEQAAFVLIDYKGGGLADAFSREGLRLPHLAGTVTNLDGAEVARSLASLQAELRRRQRMLADAKEATGDATMDVSSYQRHWAAGDVPEPMPHLFVVADEFAELKAQEPEFMDGLVSVARIGRSLGVHLVLATQKPTGVVNDQIQANSRFRVCLRVADAADSKAMIRRPDAAALEGPGRFILLVGYDERLALGQAAWAGGPYRPGAGPARDESVELCDATGRQEASAAPARGEASSGTELDAVLGELVRVAAGREARRLWLPPLEAHPTVDGLKRRYPQARAADGPWELDPVAGELDDPARQEKRLLSLPLSREGNALVYGAVGSGAEGVLAAAVWDLLEDHGPDELAVYAVDLGSGALAAFQDAPQVGGVVLPGDDERLVNLFKMLDASVKERRRATGSDPRSYPEIMASRGLPPRSVLVVIDRFEALAEAHDELLPQLVRLTRDGRRCGVYFVVSTTRANGVPYRLTPNFSQRLALRLNSKDEYLSVVGPLRGAPVPEREGMGLVPHGKELLVFQGAFAAAQGKAPDFDSVEERGAGVAAEEAADSIPVLPERVLPTTYGLAPGWEGFPVGIGRDSVRPALFDFSRTPVFLCLADSEQRVTGFLKGMLAVAARCDGVRVVPLDPSGLLGPGIDEGQSTASYVEAALKAAAPSGEERVLVACPSVRAVVQDADARSAFQEWLKGLSPGRVALIACDPYWKLSQSMFEQWCKSMTMYGAGAWVGDGVTSQSAIRIGRQTKELREPLPDDMAWLAVEGDVQAVRYTVDDEEETDE